MQTYSTMRAAYEARVAEHARRTGPFVGGCAWVRGEYVPAEEAQVPLFDLGFLRSDLTYDVPAVWDGRYFRLEDHLDRLERSLAKIRMAPPVSRDELRGILVELVRKTQLRDAYVDIIVTRGRFKPGTRDPRNTETALYAFVIPYIWVMPLDQQQAGGSAIVTRNVRRIPVSAVDPTVKNLQWGDFTRGIFEALDRGANWPFLPDADGNLTEGIGYNIVMVKDDTVMTPGRGVLEGVTRKTVLEIAEASGLKTHLGDVPIGGLYDADEIFMCTTAGGIMPITTLDGQPVGGGQVGPVTSAIWDRYWALHADPTLTMQIDYE
ncbi:MAG: aminotransferase class IV [Caulobacteraceae bacterium]|nr:aminotransferase class IV [Caulobacteraceae bacterium]